MAIDDFGGKVLGKPIQLISADHQNKADLAASKAREWFDRDGVDMITDLLNSAVALAVSGVGKDKNKVVMVVGAASSALTNANCTATTVHYAYDTYALANIAGKEIVKGGGDTWYFLTADYAFGAALEKDTSDVIKANGGKVLGSVKTPLSTTDFSSFLCRRRRRRPRSSAWPMPAATRSTRSSRPANSVSPRAARTLRRYWCSSPTSTRWASRPRRA